MGAARRYCLAAAVLLSAGQACWAIDVEGDINLLRVLLATQATNESRHQSGRIVVATREAASGDEAEGTIIWAGPKARIEYALRRPRLADVNAVAIDLAGKTLWYSAKNGLAQVNEGTKPGAGYPAVLDVRPDRCWYRVTGPEYNYYENLRWLVVLDPEQQPKSVTRFVVKKAEEDRIVIERHFFSGGTHMLITASLRHGGNVIGYEWVFGPEDQARVPAVGYPWEKGSYDWAQTADGQWYLKHCDLKFAPRGDPGQLNFDFTMDVLEYDPTYKARPSDFTLAGLKLAPGTTIEEKGKRNRTYRVGQGGVEQRGLSRDVLETLSGSLKESGFADPDRAGK